jgi:hypothetical protein
MNSAIPESSVEHDELIHDARTLRFILIGMITALVAVTAA